jgi:hypothetical protein
MGFFSTSLPSPPPPRPGPFDGYPEHVIKRFLEWHQANPHIYEEFKKLTFKMAGTGRVRYSARTIIEVMRWHYDLQTTGDVFVVNDNFTPIYVRLLIYDYPNYRSFFELRTVRSRGIFSDEQRFRGG